MAYVNLHDIPIDLFIKYFMNNKIDTDVISSNARYQPQYETYYTSNYYRYTYNIGNSLDIAINMPVIPELEISSNIAKLLFNFDQDNSILKAAKVTKNSHIVTTLPTIDQDAEHALYHVQNNDDLKKVLEANYNQTNNTLFGLSSIYTSENGKIVSGTSTSVYYLNLQNPIARYMHNLSLYPYFAEIYGRYFYSVEKSDDTFYYVINETTLDNDIRKHSLTSWFDNKITIKTEEEYDSTTKLYYYPVFTNNSMLLCGKIYILQPYKILKINSTTGKYVYTDTYNNTDIEFGKTELPLSPVMKYYNNISAMKQYSSSEVYYNNATKFSNTNNLYYLSSTNGYNVICDEIGFAFKYLNVETNNSAYGLFNTTSANNDPISTLYNDETIEALDIPDGLREEINDIVSWFNHDNSFDISHNTIYCAANNSYISLNDKPESLYVKTKPMNINEIKFMNTTYDYLNTDSKTSSVKTLFTTKGCPVAFKGTWDNYHFSEIQNITENGLTLRITKHQYSTFKKTKINFLLVDTKQTTRYKSQIINDDTTIVYYFELVTSNSLHYIKLYPLSKYLIDMINQYNSAEVYKYGKIENNLYHTYEIHTNICNADALISQLSTIHSDCTIGNIRKIFRSVSSYLSSKTSISSPLSNSSDTVQNKLQTVLETAVPSIIENKVSDTYSLSQTTDRFTMYTYMTSLFNNLLYTITPQFTPNSGGTCKNKYTNNSYVGFINYSDMDVNFIYSKHEYENTTTNPITTYELTADEIETIKNYVESKNPLSRLFNYKQYTTNAEEISALIEEQRNLKTHQQIFSSKFVGHKYGSSSTTRKDSQQVFDISDLVKKSFDLYTEYLFSDNRYDIDAYEEIAPKDILASTTQISSTPESEIQSVLDNQAFYRKDIKYYLAKMLDASNDFIYTNNIDNYELKYTFQNNDQDTVVFMNALKRIQGGK